MPRNEPDAPDRIVIEEFRPMVRNTLRGFCRVRFPSGLIVDEVALHFGSGDGRAWASPPARPMIDRDGTAMRDAATGKVRYQGLIVFTTARIRNAWSEQIVRAVRANYPDALPAETEGA